MELAYRVDGHEPEDVDAEGLEAREVGGDGGELAAGGELPDVDLVDRAAARPVGHADGAVVRARDGFFPLGRGGGNKRSENEQTDCKELHGGNM